jgi:hypothetical protein
VDDAPVEHLGEQRAANADDHRDDADQHKGRQETQSKRGCGLDADAMSAQLRLPPSMSPLVVRNGGHRLGDRRSAVDGASDCTTKRRQWRHRLQLAPGTRRISSES